MYHIFHDIDIEAYPEDIFRMFSTPEGLNIWCTVKAEGNPCINAEFRLYFSEEYDWRAKIIEFDENRALTFQIVKADHDWQNTLVSFEISSSDHLHHKLRFEHRNWSQINDHFRRSSFCWALYLNDLKKHVEQKFNRESQQ